MSRILLVTLVLLALVGAGGFNYYRNASAEKAEAPRLYRSYADEELAALIQAYESEVESSQARYDQARTTRAQRGSSTLLGDQVRDFERAQARGRQSRGKAADVAQEEAVLRELLREAELRGRDPMQLHLNRLLSL